MKILSTIKSHKFISIAIAVLLVTAVVSTVHATTRRSEEAKVVNSAQITPAEKPEVAEKAEDVKTPSKETTATPTQKATQSARVVEEEPEPVQLSRNDVFKLAIEARDAYEFKNSALQTRGVHNAVVVSYDANPSLFTDDVAESNINKCYAFLDNIKPELVSLNISKGECGL